MKIMRLIVISLLVLFLLMFFTLPVQSQDNGIENLRKTSKAFAAVARSVSPSVVFIQVEAMQSETF